MKLWIGYNSVEFLGFYINGFGLLNIKKRIAAFINLDPPTILKQFKHYIGLTGFIHYLILWYGVMV